MCLYEFSCRWVNVYRSFAGLSYGPGVRTVTPGPARTYGATTTSVPLVAVALGLLSLQLFVLPRLGRWARSGGTRRSS